MEGLQVAGAEASHFAVLVGEAVEEDPEAAELVLHAHFVFGVDGFHFTFGAGFAEEGFDKELGKSVESLNKPCI